MGRRAADAGHEPPGTEDDLRVDVGLPAPGLDIPFGQQPRAADCSSRPMAATTGPSSTTSNAKGLPAKPWGRIAVAVAPSKPQVVYANDRGESDERAVPLRRRRRELDRSSIASNFMVWRPFYFGNLIVDPKDENKIFKPDLILLLSTDGGKSFSVVSGGAHGDFHDVWIDPEESEHRDRRRRRRPVAQRRRRNSLGTQINLPVSQFYHVSTDNADPYHVYGGLQDNSSWVGDSSYPGGVTNSRWENMYGGDGFWMFEDPSDPNYIYAEAQGGEIGRVNRYTHEIARHQAAAATTARRSCASTGTRRFT